MCDKKVADFTLFTVRKIISVSETFSFFYEKEILPGLKLGEYVLQLITNDSIDFYLEKLNESRKKLLEQISKVNKESFHARKDGYNESTGYNLAWVLNHLAEDEVHHRGQISIIKKLYHSNLIKQSRLK